MNFTGRTTIDVSAPEGAHYEEIADWLERSLESVRADFHQLKQVTVEYTGHAGKLTILMVLEADPSAELDEIADQIIEKGFDMLVKQHRPGMRVVESALIPA